MLFKKALLTLSVMAAACVPAASLSGQSERPWLDYSSAATIRDQCLSWAAEKNRPIAITILDARGTMITFAHQDGASMAAAEISQWKANSSAKFGRKTSELAAMQPPANMPAVATIRGGVPIYSETGVLLGGVGTSGMKSEDDEACGMAGIEAAGLKSAKPEVQ